MTKNQCFRNFLICIFVALGFNLNLFAQSQDPKVSYPSGKRSLIQNTLCTKPEWKKDSSGIEYVQVFSSATFCQQYNDYLLPKKVGDSDGQIMSWGNKRVEKGAIFLGSHFEIVTEKEVFVLLSSSEDSKDALEVEVNDQCTEWLNLLPRKELSEKLPTECRTR